MSQLSASRTPLIFSWPKGVRAGSVYRQGLVSTVDLAPTILELAGATVPETMQGRTFRTLTSDPDSYVGPTYVFSERNWHDCDEHQRAVRTDRFKLIRTDAYTEVALCTAADIGGSPSFRALRARARLGRLTPAQQRLFEVPRARIERETRRTRRKCESFPGCYSNGSNSPAILLRRRTTIRTASPACSLTPRFRHCQNPDVPPPATRWGIQGPS